MARHVISVVGAHTWTTAGGHATLQTSREGVLQLTTGGSAFQVSNVRICIHNMYIYIYRCADIYIYMNVCIMFMQFLNVQSIFGHMCVVYINICV